MSDKSESYEEPVSIESSIVEPTPQHQETSTPRLEVVKEKNMTSPKFISKESKAFVLDIV